MHRLARAARDRQLHVRLQVGSAIALGVGLLLAATIFFGIFNSFQARLSDFLYQPHAPGGQVVLVAIDDASLTEVGSWPWSRTTIAELLSTIAAAQPRVIALTILFPESSGDDKALAQVIARAGNIVQPVIGVDITRFPAVENTFPRFDFALAPAATLQTKNTTFAHAMIVPDPDGVVRRVPAAIVASGHRYAAVGIAAVASAQNVALASSIENNSVALGAARLPVNAQGQMHLNFVSPEKRPVIKSADLLRGRVGPTALRDKIVLIGLTASATPERFRTPISLGTRPAYAVEIEADLMETLLGNHWLVAQDRLMQVVMLFLIAILAGATVIHLRWLSAIGLSILYFLMYLVYAFDKFNNGILVEPLYPALALLLVFIGTMTFRYFYEERRRAFIQRLFRRYVSSEELDRVLDAFDQGVLRLGGARRQVSVLYVELHDFTALTQPLAPEVAVGLLNQYVSLIVAIIFYHAGAVVKQMGNSILAVWNLPLTQIDHARRAARAAVQIRQEIAELNEKQSKELAVNVGLGIATGNVVAGRIGAAALTEYTITGEVITIAERLALRRDGSVFLDAPTRDQIGDEFELQEVDPLRLRRKTDPLNVWQVPKPMELEKQPVKEEDQAPVAN